MCVYNVVMAIAPWTAPCGTYWALPRFWFDLEFSEILERGKKNLCFGGDRTGMTWAIKAHMPPPSSSVAGPRASWSPLPIEEGADMTLCAGPASGELWFHRHAAHEALRAKTCTCLSKSQRAPLFRVGPQSDTCEGFSELALPSPQSRERSWVFIYPDQTCSCKRVYVTLCTPCTVSAFCASHLTWFFETHEGTG